MSTHKALLRSSASIVTGDKGYTHALTGRAQPLPAATARAAGLLTKVGSDLDAACGAVGAAVASDVRGECTRSAPPFVRFHSHRGDKGTTHAVTGSAPPRPAATARAAGALTKGVSDLDAACGAVGPAVAWCTETIVSDHTPSSRASTPSARSLGKRHPSVRWRRLTRLGREAGRGPTWTAPCWPSSPRNARP